MRVSPLCNSYFDSLFLQCYFRYFLLCSVPVALFCPGLLLIQITYLFLENFILILFKLCCTLNVYGQLSLLAYLCLLCHHIQFVVIPYHWAMKIWKFYFLVGFFTSCHYLACFICGYFYFFWYVLNSSTLSKTYSAVDKHSAIANILYVLGYALHIKPTDFRVIPFPVFTFYAFFSQCF